MVVTIGVGLLLSVAAGRVSIHLIERLPEHRQRTVQWAIVLGAACIAIVGAPLSNGPASRQIFAVIVATLPGLVAYLAWRTAVASVVISTPPLYFAIADIVQTQPLHVPATALDGLVSLQPAWVVVYWSLGAFVLLPLLVVREPRLFRRTLQSYLLVIAIAYAGFLIVPTVMVRPASGPYRLNR